MLSDKLIKLNLKAGDEMRCAVEAALTTGRLIRDNFFKKHDIQHKGWQDIVTETDLQAHHSLISILSKIPIAVVSEEHQNPIAQLQNKTRYWLIDPLDGTNNYVKRFRMFCVSIALVDDGAPILGVIYDPMRDELFCAEKGIGAYCIDANANAHILNVGEQKNLNQAVIATDWPRNLEGRKLAFKSFERILIDCLAVRTIGTVALGIVCVANSSLDAYYHYGLKPWDAAAAVVLARESGVLVKNFDGVDWSIHDSSLIASNAFITDNILSIINKTE